MKLSKLFSKIRFCEGQTTPNMLVNGCYIQEDNDGRYFLLPLGMYVFNNILSLLRTKMNSIDAQETLIPLLHPEAYLNPNVHQYGHNIFAGIINRHNNAYTLSSSPEKMYLHLLENYEISYKDLPIQFFQFGKKFRDERFNNSLYRLQEFTMLDSYSFHANKTSFKKEYQKVAECFLTFFKEVNLEVSFVKTLNAIAPNCYAHEIIVESSNGDSRYVFESNESNPIHLDLVHKNDDLDVIKNLQIKSGVELGNTYQVGYEFSNTYTNAYFRGKDGKKKNYYMGAYSIGIERTFVAVAEKNSDKHGVIWPRSIAPFDIYFINEKNPMPTSDQCEYDKLSTTCKILWDDRKEISIEEKIKTAFYIGVPLILLKRGASLHYSFCFRKTLSWQDISFNDIANIIRL